MNSETLTEWAIRTSADFPLPSDELADRLVALLLPTDRTAPKADAA